MTKRSTKKKAAKTSGRKYIYQRGLFGGKEKTKWQAAFDYRVSVLAKHKYITCSEAMVETKDDAGACPFSDWDVRKHQWKLQRMFTQLEVGNFKEPTKGEHYVMLYELYYGTQTVVTEDGEEVEIEPTISERLLIQREMLKMGGHYAPEKSEHKHDISRTEHIIMELHKMDKAEKVKEINDSKNRIKDIIPGQN